MTLLPTYSCVCVLADFEPNVKDIAKRKQLMLELEDIVRTRYDGK